MVECRTRPTLPGPWDTTMAPLPAMSLGLTPSDVHVPSAMGEPQPKKRKRTADEIIADMLDVPVGKSGLYVGRLVENDDQLEAWAQENDIELDPFPHVTVVYSSTDLSWTPLQDSVAATVTGWTILGPDKAVVLLLECDELRRRWQEAMDRGGTSSYAGFTPHVTLFYLGADYQGDYELTAPLPDFPIVLGPEIDGDPDEGDVYETAQERGLGAFTKHLMSLIVKAVQHYPAGTPGGKGGQFMPIGGHGGGASFNAPLSAGTSHMPQHYNRSVQALAQAFQTHHSNPTALLSAINAIKGPPAAHSFGQKFAAVKAQAVGLAQAVQARGPLPAPPTLPTSLPPNKTRWNGNTIARITAAGQSQNPSAALAAVSMSASHHSSVKAYYNAMVQYHGQVAQGPSAPTPAPIPAAAPRQPKAVKPPSFNVTGIQKPGRGFRNSMGNIRAMQAAAKAGNWAHLANGANFTGNHNAVAAYHARLMQHAVQHNLLPAGTHIVMTRGAQNNPMLSVLYPAHPSLAAHQSGATPPSPQVLGVATAVHATGHPPAVTPGGLPPAPTLNPQLAAQGNNGALFHQRIQQLQQAATGPNPHKALDAIQVGSPDMVKYKAALVAHVQAVYNASPAGQAAAKARAAAAAKLAAVQAQLRANAAQSEAARGIPTYKPAVHTDLHQNLDPVLSQALSTGRHADIKKYHGLKSAQVDHVLSAAAKAQGFTGPAHVVDDAEFDRLVQGGGLHLVRTVNPIGNRTADDLVHDFQHGDYYSGGGIYGNGIYATYNHTTTGKKDHPEFGVKASHNTVQASVSYGHSSGKAARTFHMVLRPDAKIGNYNSLRKQYAADMSTLNQQRSQIHNAGQRAAFDASIALYHDFGAWATSKGYDGYVANPSGGGHGTGYFVLLNRTAVAVKRSFKNGG